ncbi:hypothetical protein B0T16DRAFT_133603 [Cercophora newfieldiana]|uniref:Uncharacterized protein n=1 Tax=Cercophora newfieldiana TaxID=92897 RepID=A0AA40CUK7_9PEZI|nr:hypothetical protein B0T16DRAFT_133603 [Cercophora newfieldiana]
MPLDSSTRAFAWPAIFTHPRVLRAEDQTYLEFLRENKVVFDDSDDESSSDEFDSDPDPGEVEDNVVEGSSSSSPASSGGNVVEEPDTRHPVRLFMQPTIDGNGMGKQRLDQEQVVSEFCEYAAKQPRDPSQEDDFIAVIDIRSNAKPGSGEVSSLTGIAKPQRGGLTACQLSEELGIKEFSVPQGGSATNEENSSKSPTVGAHRELISLPDMGEPGMRVLAECASERERGALARFFYDHLQFSPSVDAAVTTQGFPKFAFHLNVPFIVFRRHKKLREDVRMKPGAPTARPLRRSWSAACLRAPSLTDEDSPMACFYEAQASIMLFGLDNRVYKVYGTIDTYYQPKSKHSVEAYHRDYKESNGERMWDPFSRRSREVNRPIWDSRHYFLSVWAGYLEQASREWDEVTTVMKEAMNQRRKTPHVTGNYVKDLDTWTEEMLDLLNVLIEPLSETTAVWKEFENCDLGYFVSNDDEEKTILLQQIKKVYSGLRLKLTSLNSLRDELKSTHRHKVHHSGLRPRPPSCLNDAADSR